MGVGEANSSLLMVWVYFDCAVVILSNPAYLLLIGIYWVVVNNFRIVFILYVTCDYWYLWLLISVVVCLWTLNICDAETFITARTVILNIAVFLLNCLISNICNKLHIFLIFLYLCRCWVIPLVFTVNRRMKEGRTALSYPSVTGPRVECCIIDWAILIRACGSQRADASNCSQPSLLCVRGTSSFRRSLELDSSGRRPTSDRRRQSSVRYALVVVV